MTDNSNVVFISADNDDHVTPRGVLSSFINDSEYFQQIVVVGLTTDETVAIGHSEGSNLEKLGLVDIAKSHLRDRMRS